MLEHTFRSASIAASVPLRETLLHGPRDVHLAIVPQLVVAEPRNLRIFAQSIRGFPSFGARLSDMWICELNIWGNTIIQVSRNHVNSSFEALVESKMHSGMVPNIFRNEYHDQSKLNPEMYSRTTQEWIHKHTSK